MKNQIRVFVLFAALAACLMGCAQAAGTEGRTLAAEGCTLTYDAAQDCYTAGRVPGIVPGQRYALLVVEQNRPISKSTVQYIDQKTAGSDGLSFQFIPRNSPACTVLLSGVFSDGSTSPMTLGTISAQGVRLEGSLQYLGDKTAPAVGLTGPNDCSYTATVTVQPGGKASYRFDAVPPGDYQLTITKIGHLPYSKAVHVRAEPLTLGSVKLLGGDVAPSVPAFINFTDLSQVLADYKKINAANDPSNVNEDDFVNFTDLNAVLSNFKLDYHEG